MNGSQKRKMKRCLFAAAAALALAGCTSLQEAAEQGDSVAQWQLGDNLMTGKNGYPVKPVEAKAWIEKSIAQENAEALAVKGEYMLQGRYGANSNGKEILDLVWPAVQQNSHRAGKVFIAAMFRDMNISVLDKASAAATAAFEGKTPYADETLDLYYKHARTYCGKALDVNGMPLADQKRQLELLFNFADTSWNYAHHDYDTTVGDRVSKRLVAYRVLARAKLDLIEKAMDISVAKVTLMFLDPTTARVELSVEVEGKGENETACAKDAMKRASERLQGVKISGSESAASSEKEKDGKVEQNSSYQSNVAAEYAGQLDSFTPLEKPKLTADGSYCGKFCATKKMIVDLGRNSPNVQESKDYLSGIKSKRKKK